MYERILVALKQEESDNAVLQHAGALALLTGGQVTLVHVVHSHSLDEAAYMEDQARDYLAQRAEKLKQRGVRVETRVDRGEAAEVITQLAQEERADLIVMATHGHSEMHHVFVGSVTEDVIRGSGIPVLLIRPEARG